MGSGRGESDLTNSFMMTHNDFGLARFRCLWVTDFFRTWDFVASRDSSHRARNPVSRQFSKCVTILFITVAALTAGCDRAPDEYVNGQGQAERDIANGQLKIAFDDGGSPGSNMPEAFWEYIQLLQKRHGIGWCTFSLPDNPRAAKAWVRGYNAVAMPKIERQVGAQVLKDTLLEAQKLHEASITKH